MSLFLTAHSLSKSFGSQLLFENISFTLSQGNRVGLLGPNGSGKSTLLKILVGEEPPDEGSISKRQGLRIGYASQSPEFPSVSLEQLLISGVDGGSEIDKLTKARILLSKAQFENFEQNASELSGGWKKRLDIARALMCDPDLLLLDEPTNHLDLAGILWLEKFLAREKTAYVVVSHDRYFLENVSNRMIELNRCYPQGLFCCDGNMSEFMDRKEAYLEGQAKLMRGVASVVRNEVAWLRTSPKARTTKSRSRIVRAYDKIEELADLQQRSNVKKLNLDFGASERETRKLLVTKNLGKSLGGKELFKGVDLVLSPGSRLGILGENGTGKTTFLKVLAGHIPQDIGTIKYAQDLKLVYFDQHREHIPGHLTLREALSPTSDVVNYRGHEIHVNGWAKRFLFSPERLNIPVSCLSGGERARILIAKVTLEPADILFLDEPTNDLDIATLEVFEESLEDFPGAVVLISHDRCLMDKVCTQVLALGAQQQFYADYSQWEQAKSNQKVAPPSVKKEERILPTTPSKKMSYKEQKEWEGMEAKILDTEQRIAELQLQLEDPHLTSEKSLEIYHALAECQKKLEVLFDRWQELERLKA